MESHTDVIIYNTNYFLPLTHFLLAIAVLLVVFCLNIIIIASVFFLVRSVSRDVFLNVFIIRHQQRFK